MNKKLFISDFSLINALGSNNTEIMNNLLLGSQDGFNLNKERLNEGDIYIADVLTELPSLSTYDKHWQSRNNQLALLAIEQIRESIQQLIDTVGKNRIAVVVGTSTSGINEGELAMQVKETAGEFPKEFDYRVQEMFNLADFIAHELALSGLTYTISTACSSSAKAFKTAQEFIDNGLCDAAIVGGVDSICGMTINGFNALQSTSSGICQPSSATRDGINIGEAAALCVLQKNKGDICLLGVGESSDAHHMSAPHPEGEGAITAMKQALKQASLQPSDVDYLNLHGTATRKNDDMEAKAVANVFGTETACSSSKGMIGHTLGAAGATEIGFCWLLLKQGDAYAPHCWDNMIDNSMPALNLVKIGEKSVSKITTCLSNSFAFGGNNVSVLIGL